MCRVYDVSRDGYNSWRRRGPSRRRLEDSELYVQIKSIFTKHEGCYGSPKITHEMRKQGFTVGQKRVARIMREHGLKAVKARLYRTHKIGSVYDKASPNRIYDLEITGENQVWVGDVTYIRMPDNSWRYVSVILDKYSRRIVAWSLSDKRDVRLTIKALERAVRNRGHHAGLIFHSDKGAEYVASGFRERLNRYGISQSMNRIREMNDNAHVESFFQQFKTERIKRRHFKTLKDLRGILLEYTRYYNEERSHSSIGYLSPSEFEAKMKLNKAVCAKAG